MAEQNKTLKVRFFDWLFNKKTVTVDITSLGAKMTSLAMQKLAYEICVQRIAKTICKCEFRVFENHKEKKSHIYWMLNVRPNPNQSATEFWQKFVEVLYDKQEVLIIEENGALYIADSYQKNDEKALQPMTFTKVTIGDTFTFNKAFTLGKDGKASYFRLSNQKVKELLASMLTEYSKLIDSATNAYRNGVGIKAKMHISQKPDAMTEDVKKVLQDGLKTFFEEPNACFLEYDGYDFQPFDSSRKGVQQSTRDIKAMLDDVLEITSKAFLMPTNIASGEVADTSNAVNDFLTFCLDPIFSLIEDGLNYSLFSEKQYLAGTKIKINSQAIKHIDLMDGATAIDKLISCGAKSVNDILKALGEEPIPEAWADIHWITKNYTAVTDLAALKDGDSENRGQGSAAGKEETTSDEKESNDHDDGSQSEDG